MTRFNSSKTGGLISHGRPVPPPPNRGQSRSDSSATAPPPIPGFAFLSRSLELPKVSRRSQVCDISACHMKGFGDRGGSSWEYEVGFGFTHPPTHTHNTHRKKADGQTLFFFPLEHKKYAQWHFLDWQRPLKNKKLPCLWTP